jgi:murein DD-endopeptidase MepM/ murein hydrolase activator NlpD
MRGRDMFKLKHYLNQAFNSVTIMVIPHSSGKPVRIRITALSLFCCLFLTLLGVVYVLSTGVRTAEYYGIRKKMRFFESQLMELKVVIFSLRRTESELTKLVSLDSKKKILETPELSNQGSLDIDLLRRQVAETIQSVSEIREYLKEQRSIYRSTPGGWPVEGHISSPFGRRVHPITGESAFHSGVDIRAPIGSPVRATADGIVSFSNWHNDSGYIVVLEHGHGFSTAYAHNKANSVTLGQRVRKGQVISLSGATGDSTGPHVHYEVWKDGKHVNPATFLGGRS